MKRISLIGAGSVVFGKNVIADILWHEALRDAEFRLMDVDPVRLDVAARMAEGINRDLGAGARIVKTRDRRRALDGADFVISTMGVGGYPATVVDHRVPARFGVRQVIGDTLGVGGIFRAVRGVPVLLDLCADMEELCPGALLLNYSNPMAMHCLAIERATRIRHIGLCHGVQNTAHLLRSLVGMLAQGVTRTQVARHMARPFDSKLRVREWLDWMELGVDPRLNYLCAGINHMAFFLRFRSGERDLYPALRRASATPHLRRLDPVRFELFDQLGWFMTETSGHTAEYVPYYLHSDAEIRDKALRVSGYLRTCRELERSFQSVRRAVSSRRSVIPLPYFPSNEHASRILNAVVTGRPYVFNGNVHNAGGALISNLPGDACVEVPCVADSTGVTPTRVGDLPPACAALIRTNINVQDLAVRGILEGDRTYIRQAMLVDPATAAQLPPRRIDELCDAMFRAHARQLPRNLRGRR